APTGRVPAVQPGNAQAPSAPNVSSWVDIAAFPAVTYSPTPGAASPAKLKRAGAAAYPANSKVYLLGGRNGVDGEDISSPYIFEYTPGSPGTWVLKTALVDNGSPGERATANMAVAVLTDS